MQDWAAFSLAFLAALSVSLGLTPVAGVLATRWDLLDQPSPRKVHSEARPLLGGVALYLGVVIGLLSAFSWENRGQLIALLAGSTFMVLSGLADDKFDLKPGVKLLVVLPISSLILVMGGIRVEVWPFRELSSRWPPLHDFLGVLLTILWMVAVTTSFAILDNMDGLCAGLTSIAAGFFLILALADGQYLVALLASSLIGASLGFLWWNRSPASIFMGDAGALVVGFVISALAIMLKFPSLTPSTSWMIPTVVLAVPLFDTFLVVFSRLRRGLPPASSPGKDHLSHRLANLGLGNVGAVRAVCILSLACGLLALILTRLPVGTACALFGALTVLGMVVVTGLERMLDRQPATGDE